MDLTEAVELFIRQGIYQNAAIAMLFCLFFSTFQYKSNEAVYFNF